MSTATIIVNASVRGLFRMLCRMDVADLQRLPRRGPAILAMNHINFLEVPLMAAFMASPRLAALSKKENLANPFFGYFARLWKAIPIDRDGVDTDSFKRCLDWIGSGGVLGLAPEGTRSRTGVLQQGKAGVAIMALRAGAPVWPVAHWGAEQFWPRLKSMRRTSIHLRVGNPFMIEPVGTMTRATRQEIADEIMEAIARLMPEAYRGPYTSTANRPPRHLRPWPL
jgi:1-acyl-sn-glycerol-3-phosphate acyltransferase